MTVGRIPSVEGGIQPTLLTTKGDIIVATGNATLVRQGVGTNGQVLTADSTQADGVIWSTPAGGAAFFPPIISGDYMSLPFGATTDVTAVNSRTYYIPIYLPACTLNRIACYTGGSFSGSGVVRLGIYNTDSNNKPSTVLLDAGTVSTNAAGTAFEITINQAITAGFYYLAFNSQTNASTNAFYGVASSDANVNIIWGGRWTGSVDASSAEIAAIQSSVTGAFATASGVAIGAGASPIVWVRFA
jgi:hypothetical protein